MVCCTVLRNRGLWPEADTASGALMGRSRKVARLRELERLSPASRRAIVSAPRGGKLSTDDVASAEVEKMQKTGSVHLRGSETEGL